MVTRASGRRTPVRTTGGIRASSGATRTKPVPVSHPSGQRVAVIDSGVQPHPRLLGRLVDGGDYIEHRGDLFDCDGHGTGMASLGPVSPLAVKSNGGAGYVVASPRLGIPAIQMSDAAYGVRNSGENGRYSTALPDDLAGAASWDLDAAYEYGTLIARELRVRIACGIWRRSSSSSSSRAPGINVAATAPRYS